jgi:hypothetical protein
LYGEIQMATTTFSGPVVSTNGFSGSTLSTTGVVILSGLPTSDPSNAGQLWNNSGVLTVSAG